MAARASGRLRPMSLSDDIGLPGDGPSTPASSVSGVAASTGAEPRGAAGHRWRPGEGLILLLWTLLVVGAVVVVLTRAEHDELTDPVKQAARGEVTGLGPLSLLTAAQFGGAMTALGDRYPDARATSIRVEPTRINASVRTGQYALHQVSVDVALKTHEDGSGETTEKGLALARVDPRGPERLVRAVNERTRTQPTDVDYLVLSVDSTSPRASRWALFLKRGTPPDQRRYTSDLAGHDVKAGS